MILSALSFMVLYVKVNEEWLTFKRKDNQILLHTSSKLEKRFAGFSKWASAIFPFTLEIMFKCRLYLK